MAVMLLAAFCVAQAQTSPSKPLLPNGVAYDAAGNLYFADTNRHQIYESSLAGVLSVIAGSGSQGFSGDGGAAMGAQLNSPQGVAVGLDGSIYIADTGNQRIRIVQNGAIATLAGDGVAGFAGDAGPAALAEFNGPTALGFDSAGALLVCDGQNHRVRRIANGTISTLAGNGSQGFAGDSGAATAAELDTPSGIAGDATGRIYIADSHNDRIRVVEPNGIIGTIAGSGHRGYSGDGGAATASALWLPRGLIVTTSGALIFADSNNHRLRMVNAGGIISTVAGNGVQGSASDGDPAATSAIDTPRGVAISTFGSPVFADARNSVVREMPGNDRSYLPAGLVPSRNSSVLMTTPSTATYGQVSVGVSVTGVAAPPRGTVQLLDGQTPVARITLGSGSGSFSLNGLTAGTHTLTAAFLGDGINPAATSLPNAVTVEAAMVTAIATAQTVEYGQAIPALTGSLSGVAPQDTGNVTVTFHTTAATLSPPGSYPITATLSGAASTNYIVALGPNSGELKIDKAASQTAQQPLTQNSYAGLPLVLVADVGSTTQGTPTGTVNFSDSGTTVGTGTLVSGVASATYIAPGSGSHSIVATYSGDANFAASSSQASVTTVDAMPDFAVAGIGNLSQTVTAGGMATYTLSITAQPAPFTGVVYLSVKGLPAGASATFSPSQTVPGSGSASVTMSVQTAASSASVTRRDESKIGLAACFLLPLCLAFRKKLLPGRPALWIGALSLLLSVEGCGTRSISTEAESHRVFSLQVIGTSTNLAGVVLSHAAAETLVVQ